MQQRAKIHHIFLNDDNTAYFFSRIKKQKAINHILDITDHHCILCEGHNVAAHAFIAFYIELLGEMISLKPIDESLLHPESILPAQFHSLLIHPI